MLRNKAILVSILVLPFLFAGLALAEGRDLQAAGPYEATPTDLELPDAIAPVTSISFDSTPDEHGRYLAPVTVTLTAEDNMMGSGVSYTLFCTHLDPGDSCDGTDPVLYTGPFVINESGIRYVTYLSVDNAGNQENPWKMTSVDVVETSGVRGVLDVTAPVTTLSLDPITPNGLDGWYLNPVTVTLEATDDESGINQILFCTHLDPGDSCDGVDPVVYTGPFVINESGVRYVTYLSIDNADNQENPWNMTSLKIDAELPNGIAMILNGDEDINTTGEVLADLTVSQDAISGLSHCDIDWGDSSVETVNINTILSHTFSDGTYTVNFVCFDNAGNAETVEKSVTVDTSIDETPEPETPTPPTSNGGGSSSGGSSSFGGFSSIVSAVNTPVVGQVLGASSNRFRFTRYAEQGSRLSPDVMELQKRLFEEKFLSVPATGYFGPITKAALMKYQQAKNLNQTGALDVATRTTLNGDNGQVLGANVSLISVLEQLLVLLKR